MAMPRFSIATALYNHKPFLAERVRSVLAQTEADWEWVIVDDCSTDGSYEEIRRLTAGDRRVRVLRNEVNRRFSYTSDRAVRETSGEYLYRADSDDSCHDRFLEAMGAELDADDSLAMALCRGLYMDEHDRVWGGRPRRPDFRDTPAEAVDRLLVRNICNAPTVLLRRSLVDEVGGVAAMPELRVNTDWFLLLRLAARGGIRYIDRPLGYYRRHGANISVDQQREPNMKQMEIEQFEMLHRVWPYIEEAGLAWQVRSLEQALHHSADIVWKYVVHPATKAGLIDPDAWLAMIQRHVPDYAPPAPGSSLKGRLSHLARIAYAAWTREPAAKHAKRAV